jgi:rhamnose transport system permease protein
MNTTINKFFSKNVRELVLTLMIVLVTIAVQIRTNGGFFTEVNISDLFREDAILLMVSMGMMIVILSGGIDLSIGSIMGLCGMLGALILKNNRDINLVLLFFIVIGIGCLCGAINGFIVAKLHIYPLIGTLATQYIFRGVIYLFSHGKWVPQVDMTPEFISITSIKIFGINALVWFAIIVTMLGYLFLKFTKPGRYVYAVGNSESSAEITGIKTRSIKIMAYMICGAICGLAGLLWVCKYGNAQSESCHGYEISIIAAIVVGGCSIAGGLGTVAGVVLGAILIGTLNNILPLIQVSTYWQMSIRGSIILISIIINAMTQKNVKKNALRRRVL